MNAELKRNPVFWLMWMIPVAAVFAGFAMLAVAMESADRALPDIYHWEGEQLDADFERARVAARQHLEAELVIAAAGCELNLRGAEPQALMLALTSGTDIRLDRRLTLVRDADGIYRGACAPLTRGKWRIALQDPAGSWSLRAEVAATDRIALVARSPEAGR